MPVIKIPYKARVWALENLHNRNERWIVLVIHRRGGKSTAAINHLQRDALRTPNAAFAFIAPTYKQVKRIVWEMAKFYARNIPDVQFNEVDLRIRYPNGSTLTMYGADNPDSLRGIGLWGVVFDEYSQQPSNIFSEIIRPALADHEGYAIWIGTPKGRNEFFKLYSKIKNDGTPIGNPEAWHCIKLTVDDTGLIPTAELDDAKANMNNDEFQQEWYCSFDAAIKGAVFASQLNDMRLERRIGILPYDRALKVYTVWDRGVGENLVVGFFQRSFGQLKLIDTWQGKGNDGLPEALVALQGKPYVYGKHFGPHDIEGTDASSGKTWKQTAMELGYDFTVVQKMPIKDRIHIATIALSHTWVDAKNNDRWIDAMSQYHYVWDDVRGAFRDDPDHDWTSHFADMYCYAAVVEEQMDNEFDSPRGVFAEPVYDVYD